jgi:predicted nucleic acid-binding protein
MAISTSPFLISVKLVKLVIDASIGIKAILPEQDSANLALSEEDGCPLLTDDQKFINAAKGFSFMSLNDL